MRPAPLALLALVALAPLAQAASYTVHAGRRPDGALYFSPRELRVAQDEIVTLTLVNDDRDTPHDWALLEYGGRDIEAYVPGGESRTISFKANVPGEFRIVCQVVGHKQQGMEGTLVVEEKSLLPAPALPAALALLALVALARGRRPA